jgi:peptide/nickel transport system ATP-binding protein
MYAGRIIEEGPTAAVLRNPRHPYSHGLLASLPSRAEPGRDLAQISGSTPSLLRLPEGCSFRPRCGEKTDACLRMPEIERHGARAFRCHHPLAAEVP